MVRTRDDSTAAVAVEACPVCASLRVETVEPDWFAVELERADELRAHEFEVEFACRECRTHWR
jgi:hypothetical protein